MNKKLPKETTRKTEVVKTTTIVTVTNFQKLLFWGTLATLIIYFLISVQGILLPFIAGFIIAYIFSPLVDKFERKGVSRSIISVLIIIMVFGVLVTIISLAWPYIQTEVVLVARKIPSYSILLQDQITALLDSGASFVGPADWMNVKSSINSYLSDVFSWFGRLLRNFVTNGLALANLIVLIVITPIVSFYMLRDWNKLFKSIYNFIPEGYKSVVARQANLMNTSLRGYAKGQTLVCLTLGTYYGTALYFVGLESGALIGFLTGLFAFIPFLAAISGFTVASIVAIYQGPELMMWFWVIATFAIGQTLEASLLTPNLIGERIGLHPVWVIFVVLSGASLAGFWGAVFALPVASIISVLSKFALEIYYASPFHKTKAPQGDS